MNNVSIDSTVSPSTPISHDDQRVVVEGLILLKKRQKQMTSHYWHLVHALDNDDKAVALAALTDIMHELAGSVGYLPDPALDEACRQFYHLLQTHPIGEETEASRGNLAQAYQQVLACIDAFSSEFDRRPETTLEHFLRIREADYIHQIDDLPLFNPARTKHWTTAQQQKFVNDFYHIRGHFYQLLWLLAMYAPNCPKDRALILDNIQEELGGEHGCSHEQLYIRFAKELSVHHLEEAFITHQHVPKYIDDYNRDCLTWFKQQPWEQQLAGFAAYERLDNTDYGHLLELGKSLGVEEYALEFFIVHNHADHFDRLKARLGKIWQHDRQGVKIAFDFIQSHQVAVWQKFSDELFA